MSPSKAYDPETNLENPIEGPFSPNHVVLLFRSRVAKPHGNCGLLCPHRVRRMVVRSEAMPGLFRPWVNTILELDVSKLILEAGLHALPSNLALLRWLCIVMMFGPECQLNFQLWQLLLCPGSQGLLRKEAIYFTPNRDVFYHHPAKSAVLLQALLFYFPESKSACEGTSTTKKLRYLTAN